MSLTIQQWKDTGLLPSGLQAWHKYLGGISSGGLAGDYSGNGRDLVAASNTPTIVANIGLGDHAGWYFNGTRNPLKYTGSVAVQHVFVLANYDDALFAVDFPGLWNSPTSHVILMGDAGTNHFYNNSGVLGAFTYRKNNTIFPNAGMTAPMSAGPIALLEIQLPAAVTLDGIQVGEAPIVTARKWKGIFVESMAFDHSLSAAERSRVLLYFNLEFGLNTFSLPVSFPSDDYMPIRRRRFYAEPPQMSKITDSFEFEDGGKTFNESGSTAPRRWEYNYILTNPAASTDPPAVRLFDEFYAAVRLSQAFNFTDKYGTVWDNVRVESYDRSHDTYKPWRQEINFKLIRHPK